MWAQSVKLILWGAIILVLNIAPTFAQSPSSYPLITPWSDDETHIYDSNTYPSQRAKTYYLKQRYANNQNQPSSTQTQKSGLNAPNHQGRYQYQDPNLQARTINTTPNIRTEQASTLEKLYSARTLNDLTQFGYDLFGIPSDETALQLELLSQNYHQSKEQAAKRQTPMGAVQDDFILQSGDEVEIMFTGQRKDRAIYTITAQGTILIEDFPPIPAAGRTIGQVHLSLQAAASNLYNTQSYISLASVRQIGVLVIGHVKKPGRKNMTVFNSILDALMQSGGIEKTGSLRNIKLIRNGHSTIIDLYNLLMHGGTGIDLTLRDGDRIIIPPIGPTVAVAGEVKRPGIYELKNLPSVKNQEANPHIEKLSLNDMLDLGGGVLISGQNRFLKLEINDQGDEKVTEIKNTTLKQFKDGSILMVSKGKDKRSGTIELKGYTRKAGLHALSQNKKLADLLNNENILSSDTYPLIGIIERWDKDQLTTKLIDFPLRLVLKNKYDKELEDNDVIHLFSNKDIESLQQENIAPFSLNIDQENNEEDQSELSQDPILQSYLTERSVYIRGAVRKEGAYPISNGITLDSILAVAGGLTLDANEQNIEITFASNTNKHTNTRRRNINLSLTAPHTIQLEAGDSIRVNKQYKKLEENSVIILGEVISPGSYDLMPGDRLSDLIKRAGGMTRQAYPDGAIFSRASERKAEKNRFKAAARDLERAVAVAIQKAEQDNKDGPDLQKIAMAQELSAELRNIETVGRITVEADPFVLDIEPELDLLLEKGDRIFVPKRPLTVRVRGEVLSPASLQFRKDKDPRNYIDEAGGFTFNADKGRTFVLYPDGSARPLSVSSWNHRASLIPPGSTIVVPRDPKPFDFIQSAKDISQILSNLAITGVFIDDLRDDD